jgi:hypothetical protein
VSLSTNKYRCSTAERDHARHSQRWRNVVSCFQVEYPAPGSAAPASRCARTKTATVPATIGEHPADTHTAALKVTLRTDTRGKNQNGLNTSTTCNAELLSRHTSTTRKTVIFITVVIFQRRRLKNEREILKNSVLKVGNWPASKSELTNRNLKQFIRYINPMDLQKTNHSNKQK